MENYFYGLLRKQLDNFQCYPSEEYVKMIASYQTGRKCSIIRTLNKNKSLDDYSARVKNSVRNFYRNYASLIEICNKENAENLDIEDFNYDGPQNICQTGKNCYRDFSRSSYYDSHLSPAEIRNITKCSYIKS